MIVMQKSRCVGKSEVLRTIEKEILAELDQYQEKEGQLTYKQQKYAANIV